MDAGTPMTPEILGRDAELTAISELVEVALSGRGATILAFGEAGIGKSRLALAAAKQGAEHGALVATGGCIAVGGEPLRHVALAEIIGQLEPGATVSTAGSTEELLERTLGALRSAASERPVILVIEDLHWADSGTAQIVMALTRFARPLPVLGFLTARDDELGRADPRSRFLAELARSELVTTIRLGRLERDDVVRQIELLLGPAVEPDIVAEIVTRSSGNPLLVEELCGDVTGTFVAGQSLLDVLTARFSSLSSGARDVVSAVAVAGMPVDDELLAHIVEPDGCDAHGAIDEAVDAHVLEITGRGVDFRHAALAEAVRRDMPSGRRGELHRRWASALATSDRADADASVIAHHWAEGGEPASALEASWLAGAIAEFGLAADAAHAQYRRVLELWDAVPDASERIGSTFPEVVVRAAEMGNRAGESEAAAELIRRVVSHADIDRPTSAILHERRGWYLLRAGRVEEARDAYREAVDRVGPGTPPDLQARVVAGSVRIWERLGELDRAVDVATQAVGIANDSGDRTAIGQAQYMLGHALMRAGRFDEAEDVLLAAASIAEEILDPAALGWSHIALAGCATQRSGLRGVITLMERSAQRLRERGEDDPFAAISDSLGAALALRLGEVERARRIGAVIVASATTTIGAGLGHLVVGLAALERLDLDRAREHLDEARSTLGPLYDGRIAGTLALGRADLFLAEGVPELAAAIIREGIVRVEHTGDDEILVQLAMSGLRVERELAVGYAGDQTLAAEQRRRNVEEYATIVDRVQARTAVALADLEAAAVTIDAERAGAAGRPDPGVWRSATEAWSRAQWPRLAVYARIREAEAALRLHDFDTAAATLDRVLRDARAIDSRLLEGRARRFANRAGLDLAE